MRLRATFLALPLLACLACAPSVPPSAASAPAPAAGPDSPSGRPAEAEDAPAFSFDPPGDWEKKEIEGGYDYRRGTQEQIIVTRLPAGTRMDDDIDVLSSAQQAAVKKLCKRGMTVSPPERAKDPLALVRVRVTCAEPQVAVTFVAAGAHGTVLSYEHYRYDSAKITPAIKKDDAAIFSVLHLNETSAPSSGKTGGDACPRDILAQVSGGGTGMCLEKDVLGEAVLSACARKLRTLGWTRNDVTTSLIAQQTGKKSVVCFDGLTKN